MKTLDHNYKERIEKFLFETNWLEVPFYHNNKGKTLRFDLESKPEMENVRLIKNIFDDVFFPSSTMFVIFYCSKNFQWGIGKKYFNKFGLKFLLKKEYVPRNDDMADENVYIVACLTDRNKFKMETYLTDYLEGNRNIEMAFVSLKKGTAIQLYDARGFDVLSVDRKFLKILYERYEGDIIEFNRKEILAGLQK